jgi:hypothetical protein
MKAAVNHIITRLEHPTVEHERGTTMTEYVLKAVSIIKKRTFKHFPILLFSRVMQQFCIMLYLTVPYLFRGR